MVICAVIKCKSRSHTTNFTTDGVSYHRFPKQPILRQEWTKFCRRDEFWVPKRTSTICSKHFDHTTSYQYFPDNRKKLNENAKPTIFNPGDFEETNTAANGNDNKQSLNITHLDSTAHIISDNQQITASGLIPLSEEIPCAKPMPLYYVIQPIRTISFSHPTPSTQIMPLQQEMLSTQPTLSKQSTLSTQPVLSTQPMLPTRPMLSTQVVPPLQLIPSSNSTPSSEPLPSSKPMPFSQLNTSSLFMAEIELPKIMTLSDRMQSPITTTGSQTQLIILLTHLPHSNLPKSIQIYLDSQHPTWIVTLSFSTAMLKSLQQLEACQWTLLQDTCNLEALILLLDELNM